MLFSEPKIPQCPLVYSSSSRHNAFQCSSASRKFLNHMRNPGAIDDHKVSVLFSEPKIPQCLVHTRLAQAYSRFQCSSASRKFLNCAILCSLYPLYPQVSVLFSEPKIPQSGACASRGRHCHVSVLFSEPKIPQSGGSPGQTPTRTTFQCSSASRKFLNRDRPSGRSLRFLVSVLFSEPKIPQSPSRTRIRRRAA